MRERKKLEVEKSEVDLKGFRERSGNKYNQNTLYEYLKFSENQ